MRSIEPTDVPPYFWTINTHDTLHATRRTVQGQRGRIGAFPDPPGERSSPHGRFRGVTSAMIELQSTQVSLSGLLSVLGEHLYSTPNVVVRELVQNAHDSCMRRRLEAAGTGG